MEAHRPGKNLSSIKSEKVKTRKKKELAEEDDDDDDDEGRVPISVV